MSLENAFRWILFFPVAVFAGLFMCGATLYVGDDLVGNWRVPSGLVIFLGAFSIPFVWMRVGLKIAPRKNQAVKWILLSPLLLVTVVQAVAVVLLILGSFSPSISKEESFSHSLSVYWQVMIFNWGFICATLFVASMTPSEIAE
jgi:hypothetical protein